MYYLPSITNYLFYFLFYSSPLVEHHGHSHGIGLDHGHSHGGDDDDDDDHHHHHGGGGKGGKGGKKGKGKHSHGHGHGHGHDHGDHHDHHHGHHHDKKGGNEKDKSVMEKERSKNLNVRAAFIHVLGDIVQTIGVFAAGLVIYFKPEWHLADPICTFLFSVLVVFTTFPVCKDIFLVMMESCPPGFDLQGFSSAIIALPNVVSFHDLHVWVLGQNRVAMTLHVVVRSKPYIVDPHDIYDNPTQSQSQSQSQSQLITNDGGLDGGSGPGTTSIQPPSRIKSLGNVGGMEIIEANVTPKEWGRVIRHVNKTAKEFGATHITVQVETEKMASKCFY